MGAVWQSSEWTTENFPLVTAYYNHCCDMIVVYLLKAKVILTEQIDVANTQMTSQQTLHCDIKSESKFM